MWLLGVVVRRYIDFLILLSAIFYSSIPTFCSLKKNCFRSFRRRKKKNAKSRFFYDARCVHKLALYSDVIHIFDWKSAVEHDGGV